MDWADAWEADKALGVGCSFVFGWHREADDIVQRALVKPSFFICLGLSRTRTSAKVVLISHQTTASRRCAALPSAEMGSHLTTEHLAAALARTINTPFRGVLKFMFQTLHGRLAPHLIVSVCQRPSTENSNVPRRPVYVRLRTSAVACHAFDCPQTSLLPQAHHECIQRWLCLDYILFAQTTWASRP